MSSYTEKRVTQALDVQAPRSDVRNALASPLTGSISQNNEKNNAILNQDKKDRTTDVIKNPQINLDYKSDFYEINTSNSLLCFLINSFQPLSIDIPSS